jgi:hypothetical protein
MSTYGLTVENKTYNLTLSPTELTVNLVPPSDYVVNIDNPNYITNFESVEYSLSLSRTGSQGSKGDVTNIDYASFDLASTHSVLEGELAWNSAEGTLDLGLGFGVVNQLGQETHIYAKATETILDGEVVYVSGTPGLSGKLEILKYIADNSIGQIYVAGIATHNIGVGEFGYVTVFGTVRGLNTTGALEGETWSAGDVLYASPTVAGRRTNLLPVAPNLQIPVAIILATHPINGTIFVRAQDLSHKLGELHDVHITSITTGEIIKWDGTRFVNNTLAEAGISETGHTHSFSVITDTPTTLAGYGITDGGSGSGATELSGLSDVLVTTPQEGDALLFDSASGDFQNYQLTTSRMSDIDNTNRADGSVLVYNGTATKYVATNSIDNGNLTIKGGSF